MEGKKQLGRAYLFPDVNDIAQERYRNVAKHFMNSHLYFQCLYPYTFHNLLLLKLKVEKTILISLDNPNYLASQYK